MSRGTPVGADASTAYADGMEMDEPKKASRSARRRILWTVTGTFAAAAIVWGTMSAIDVAARGTATEAVRFTEPIERLHVTGDASGLRLRAGAGPGVEGTVTITHGLRSPGITAAVDGATLNIHVDCPAFLAMSCGAKYDLAVPATLAAIDVDISGGGVTVDGGGIATGDLAGLGGQATIRTSGGGIHITGGDLDVAADTSGGGITVAGAGGTLDLDTSGGGVDVRDGRSRTVRADSSGGGVRIEMVVEPDEVVASSSGGGVTVLVPRGQALYAVDTRSDGGSDRVGVRTDPTSSRTITVHSSGGSVQVAYRGEG